VITLDDLEYSYPDDGDHTIELIQKLPGQASVSVTWPSSTKTSPAKFGEMIPASTRILSSASMELARLHITPESSSSG
jgi:hypothetical protein